MLNALNIGAEDGRKIANGTKKGKTMTDKEKLIDLLDEVHHRHLGKEYLERLTTIADYLIANGVTLQRWIPVTERLPEDDGKYLIYRQTPFGARYTIIGFAKNGRKVDEYDFQEDSKNVWYSYDCEFGYIIHDSVTHWMPIPTPPKEE